MHVSYKVVQGDITELKVEAIVNSANSMLIRGSGVCGAIYKKAGEQKLTAALSSYAPLQPGEAIISQGYALPCQYIIHTLSPKYVINGGDANRSRCTELSYCYASILHLVDKHNITQIAMPCLGCGHHNWPLEEALGVAVQTIDWISANKYKDKALELIFCGYTLKDAVTKIT